jgi:hypothetical protein
MAGAGVAEESRSSWDPPSNQGTSCDTATGLCCSKTKCSMAHGWLPQAHRLWICHPWGGRWIQSKSVLTPSFKDPIDAQRQIMSLIASTSNSADTVVTAFKAATIQYGIPSRVRGDRGGENLKVAAFMIQNRGLNRSSFIFGKSTHNTRIERLWGEVGSQFARRWRGFFQRLQFKYSLNHQDPHHLWLLKELFLTEIQADCKLFVAHWNHHGIRGPAQSQSPEVGRLIPI